LGLLYLSLTWNIKVNEMVKEVTEMVLRASGLEVAIVMMMMNTCTVQKHILILFTL
jgi:hypothetical protein